MAASEMRAMVMARSPGRLELRQVPVPDPGDGQILVKVHACGVCRTDLHVIDGELTAPRLPLVPGHEVVRTVAALGRNVESVREGERVFALVRPGDEAAKRFARDRGAVWAGDSHRRPPEELDAAIIFAPVGALVPRALERWRI